MTTSEEYERYSMESMTDSSEASADERPDAAQLHAMAGIQQALLAVVVELRRSNDSRDQFYTEVLDLLVRITEDPYAGPEGDGSPRSGQPAAAPDGQEGGDPR